ncbi:GntR family transcriptional regulator, partial [Streptomyces sp. NPDC057621]|uniref:GntR family transcriptional regulator n=1 Tax=Streptomyces sp. NPDC057621 TaxID=3346186 RepID=UPI0036CB7C56
MPEAPERPGRESPEPSTVEQIRAVMHARLADGTYAPGTMLPSLRTLAPEFGVSHTAVDLALRPLKDKGILRGDGSRGTVVTHQVNAAQQPVPQDQADDPCGVRPGGGNASGSQAEDAEVPHDGKPAKSGRNATVERVRETIRERLDSGRYPPGSCLPKQSELAGEFGVPEQLIREVFRPLKTDGTLH